MQFRFDSNFVQNCANLNVFEVKVLFLVLNVISVSGTVITRMGIGQGRTPGPGLFLADKRR